MVFQLCPDIQTSYSAFRRVRRGSCCHDLIAQPCAVKSCSIIIIINYLYPWPAQRLQPRLWSPLEALHRRSRRLSHLIPSHHIPSHPIPFRPIPSYPTALHILRHGGSHSRSGQRQGRPRHRAARSPANSRRTPGGPAHPRTGFLVLLLLSPADPPTGAQQGGPTTTQHPIASSQAGGQGQSCPPRVAASPVAPRSLISHQHPEPPFCRSSRCHKRQGKRIDVLKWKIKHSPTHASPPGDRMREQTCDKR